METKFLTLIPILKGALAPTIFVTKPLGILFSNYFKEAVKKYFSKSRLQTNLNIILIKQFLL